jgi:hypothetical protein
MDYRHRARAFASTRPPHTSRCDGTASVCVESALSKDSFETPLLDAATTVNRVLIVITGPSHAGKSTLLNSLVSLMPDLAVVTYDHFFMETLRAIRGGQDPDLAEFSLAYELMGGVVQHLIARGRPTVIESTFTRVSKKDRLASTRNGSVTYRHDLELHHLLSLDIGNAFAFQLFAPWEVIRSRLNETPRLEEWVVKGTWEAHSEPWPGCSRLDAEREPQENAADIATRVRGRA